MVELNVAVIGLLIRTNSNHVDITSYTYYTRLKYIIIYLFNYINKFLLYLFIITLIYSYVLIILKDLFLFFIFSLRIKTIRNFYTLTLASYIYAIFTWKLENIERISAQITTSIIDIDLGYIDLYINYFIYNYYSIIFFNYSTSLVTLMRIDKTFLIRTFIFFNYTSLLLILFMILKFFYSFLNL